MYLKFIMELSHQAKARSFTKPDLSLCSEKKHENRYNHIKQMEKEEPSKRKPGMKSLCQIWGRL